MRTDPQDAFQDIAGDGQGLFRNHISHTILSFFCSRCNILDLKPLSDKNSEKDQTFYHIVNAGLRKNIYLKFRTLSLIKTTAYRLPAKPEVYPQLIFYPS